MSIAGYRSGPSRVLLAPVLLIVSLGALAASARALIDTVRHADVLDYAGSLERGAAPDARYVAQFYRDNDLASPNFGCGDSISRSRLTVAFAACRAAVESHTVALIDEATKNVLIADEDRLACNPLDGNAWLQLSRMRSSVEGVGPEIVEELKMSLLTAPSESWIMGPRLDFASGLASAGVANLEPGFGADLRRFVQFEPTARVSAVYVDQPNAGRARLQPLIESEPEARKKAIIAEINRLGVDFRRP